MQNLVAESGAAMKWVRPFNSTRYGGQHLVITLLTLAVTAQACPDVVVDEADECTENCGPPWSPDGDLFSTPVELNEANRIPAGFYDLDPEVFDEYTGRATGSPGFGSLNDGVNYVDVGTGYQHYLGTDPVDSDDWATIHLINLMEAVGRDWEPHRQQFGLPKMMVGDASIKFGGPFPPHTQHQNGLELDVRYIRTDFQFFHNGHLDVCVDDEEEYDEQATAELLIAFLNNGDESNGGVGEVDKIIVGRCMGFDPLSIDQRLVVDQSGGHDDHFHVLIHNPGN